MRPQDKIVFSDAARNFGWWILVRRTNPASLKFIGLAGYVPKPIDCKPKTADRDSVKSRSAGLVVDPTLCPEAFSAEKLVDARDEWTKFSRVQRIGQPGCRYSVVADQRSQHYGALLLDRNHLHGDYDLYDIIDPAQACRNLASVEEISGAAHMRGPGFLRVQQFINSRIGANMVQHGGEMQYRDHREQSIDAFGPAGEECTILNEYSIRGWYRERFDGRQPIDLKKQT